MQCSGINSFIAFKEIKGHMMNTIPKSQHERRQVSKARILRLFHEYKKINNDYFIALDQVRQLEQTRLTIQRTLKHELISNNLNQFVANKHEMTAKLVHGKPRVVIDTSDLVPPNYFSVRLNKIYDMQRIEFDLKKGKKIPGVRLETDKIIDIDLTSKEGESYEL